MDAELEMEDDECSVKLPLRKMSRKQMQDLILQMGSKQKARSDEDNAKEIEKADKEREELANMYAESRGAAPSIPATKEDFPESLQDQIDDEHDEEEEEGEDKKPKAKKVKK